MIKDYCTPECIENARWLILRFVTKHGGNPDDARDALQEGFTVFFENLNKPDFELTTKPELFIFTVSKNWWCYEIARRNTKIVNCDDFEGVEEELDFSIDEKNRKEKQLSLLKKYLPRLSKKCNQVIKFRYEGLSCEEIAERMKWKKGDVAKDKFYRCKKRFLELVSEDPEYSKL